MPRLRSPTIALCVSASVALAACGGSSSKPAPRPAGPLPAATALAPIRVGGSPSAVAVGAGSVWVADRTRGRVVRIDPATRRPAGRPIRVGTGPFALAVAGNRVWVADGDGSVRSIDARTGAVRDDGTRIDGANGLAADADGVWVTSRIAGTVTRIDPATGKAGPPIATGAGAADVVLADGAVWVANRSFLSRVDPRTGKAGPPIGAGLPAVLALAADRGGLWVARAGGQLDDEVSVARFDPASRKLTGRAIPLPATIPLDLAAGGGSLWATDSGSVLPLGRPRAASLTRIDGRGEPDGRTAASLDVGPRPVAVATGAGGVWIADAAAGTVTPVRVGV